MVKWLGFSFRKSIGATQLSASCFHSPRYFDFFCSVVSLEFTVENDLPATWANKCASFGRVFPTCPFAMATSCVYDACRDLKMESLNQGKTSRENFGSKNEGLNLIIHFAPRELSLLSFLV